MHKKIEFLFFLIIVLGAFFLRTYNVNWDAGSHIHPDERFLTMVTSDMRVPNSLADYLNPQVSTMNPHNINYGFFVYGTFPLYLVKFLATFLKMDNYNDIALLGRYLSALFDTGIVLLLYFLTKKIQLSVFGSQFSDKSQSVISLSVSKTGKQKTDKQNSDNRKLKTDNRDYWWTPLLPPFLYSIMVLPIQLSHFFATDTFLVFFMIASFYISVSISARIATQSVSDRHRNIFERNSWNKIFLLSVMLGISIGLGLASKITMIFIIPLDLLVIFSSFFICRDKPPGLSANQCGTTRPAGRSLDVGWRSSPTTKKIYDKRQIVELLIHVSLYSCIPIFVSSYFFFRMAMPMAFSDANFFNLVLNPQWIKNLMDLQSMSSYSLQNTFPPSIQWFTTEAILFPLKNMILWGMGAPLAALCVVSLFYLFFINSFIFFRKITIAANLKFKNQNSKLQFKIQNEKKFNFLAIKQYNNIAIFLLLFFTLAFFAFEGSQFVKPLRYIYPIYWCFALFAGLFVVKMFQKMKSPILFFVLCSTFFISLLVYPISFLQIYSRPHTRVSASRFMFQNLPPDSKITFEEWDDPLPLLIDGHTNEFPGTALPMFWPDSQEKWDKIVNTISQTDYIVLSSNRVYGSIVRRPDLYPQTKKYYELLFASKLGFEKVVEFTSRPTIPLINYELIDDAADETFTVYDHPHVSIYKNTLHLNKDDLYKLIYQP